MALDPVTRHVLQIEVLDKTVRSISRSPAFYAAIDEFEEGMDLVNRSMDETCPQYPAGVALSKSLRKLLYSAADYHCARTLFDVLSAFHAMPDQEEEEKEKQEEERDAE